MMTFNELFSPDLPDDSYYGVYVPFVWFDLERVAGAFGCDVCRAPTRWRWFDTEESYITVCGTDCLEKLYENNKVPVCIEGNEGTGPEHKETVPASIEFEAGTGLEQLRLPSVDGAGLAAGSDGEPGVEGFANM